MHDRRDPSLDGLAEDASRRLPAGLLILFLNGLLTAAFAHGVAEGDRGYIQKGADRLTAPS